MGVRGNALNGQRHLARTRREAQEILRDLLRGAGNGVGLDGGFSGIDRNLFAGFEQLLTGRSEFIGLGRDAAEDFL
jgi:hypothetical protein